MYKHSQTGKRLTFHNKINKACTNLAVLLDTRISLEFDVEHQKSTAHKR